MLLIKYSSLKITGRNLEFLRIYLKFGFVLGFIPFKLTKNEFTGKYGLESSVFSKIRCGLVNGFTALHLLRGWKGVLTNDPIQYFAFALTLCGTLSSVNYQSIFWTKQNQILKIFNEESRISSAKFQLEFTCKAQSDTSNQSLLSRVQEFFCTTTFLSILGCVACCVVATIELSISVMTRISQAGLSYSVLDPDFVLEFVFFVFGQISSIQFHFQDFLLLIVTFLVKQIVYDCNEQLKIKNLSGKQALKSYETMKSKVSTVNNVFRSVIFYSVFDAVPFYSFYLFLLIEPPPTMTFLDLAKKFNFWLYFCFLGKTLLMAAGANKEAGGFGNWLSKGDNASKIPCSKLTLISHELAAADIGVWGNNFFVISYNFVGSITGLVITYAILATQLQSGNKQIANSLGY